MTDDPDPHTLARNWERIDYTLSVRFILDGGRQFEGKTIDISLAGVFINLNQGVSDEIALGKHGQIHIIPDTFHQVFPCKVVRVTQTGIGLQFRDKEAAFGMYVSQYMMQEVLFSTSHALAKAKNLDEIVEICVKQTQTHLQARASSLFILDHTEEVLVCHGFTGPVDIKGVCVGRHEGIIGRVMRSKQGVIIQDVQSDPDFANKIDQMTGFKTESILAAPLIVMDKVIGVMEVLNKRGAGLFEGQDLLVVRAIAVEAALAISNIKQMEDKAQAVAANAFKAQFLAHMSHEIRTPMNAIIGLSDLALGSSMSSKMRDYLAKISNASHALRRVIDDILDFSKIEANKLDLKIEDFSVRDILGRVVDLFRLQASNHQVELIVSVDIGPHLFLRGDPLRLEQILINLVGNALKFTEKGEVILSVQAHPLDEQGSIPLTFSVQDTGIGMNPAQIERLFIPFVQADGSYARKYEGTGLGLSISRRLVEMMGGSITVESFINQGSTFSFTLLFEHPLEPLEKDWVVPDSMRALRILVVDDHAKSRHSLQEMINHLSFESVGVSSGEEALSVARQAEIDLLPFQLVLVDWRLSFGLSGRETLGYLQESLRHSGSGLSPKYVILSDFSTEKQVRQEARNQQIDACLSKPVNYSTLFDTIMTLFEQEVARIPRRQGDQIQPGEVIQAIGGARVLLVEDNAINRQVAQEILEGVGLIVEMAHNGLDAIQKVSETVYHAVLMDIQMPKMDGYDATRWIREKPAFENLPIIAMTAHAMSGEREKCLAAGMNDHITKPIDKNLLYGSLLRWIQPPECPVEPRDQKERQGDRVKSLNLDHYLTGMDVASALERINHNETLFLSLLWEFHQSFSSVAEQIRTSLQANDEKGRVSAEYLTHSVKGMAGNLSAQTLHEAAVALEKGIRENQRDRWPALLLTFETALHTVMESIAILKQTQGDGVSKDSERERTTLGAGDWETIRAVIQELSSQLEGFSIQSQDTFEQMKSLMAGRGHVVQEEMTLLARQVDQFDFHNAVATLKTLSKKLGDFVDPPPSA